MNTYPPIEIAKPGRAVSASGAPFDFTPAVLADLAESYDPALWEAPLVVGHPKLNEPRYGSVGLVAWNPGAGRLTAQPSHVDPSFAEAVNRKLYQSVSMSVYLPDAPGNPRPGHHYLRHVGFLGAHPPAIKGLSPVSFAESEAGVVEFSEFDDSLVARLFRQLREWMIGTAGQETADRVLPGGDIDYLQQSAALEGQEDLTESGPAPAFSEPPPQERTMSETKTAEFAERESALASRERQLADREAEFSRREIADFAEGLIRDGKLLPRDKPGVIEFMAALPADDALEFGEGDARRKTASRAWFEEFLKRLPKQVDFAEYGNEESDASKPSDAQIAQRAREYKKKIDESGGNLSFAEAVDAVNAGLDRR